MIPFLKMHGCGNDFVVIDSREDRLFALQWQLLADRHIGIGCDQVVILEKSRKADLFMRIFNADGQESKSCGNASRCVAWLLNIEKNKTSSQEVFHIETKAGIIEAFVKDEWHVTVDMGEPCFDWEKIPLTNASLTTKKDTLHLRIGLEKLQDPVAVSMGNPHMVFFVPNVKNIPLEQLGPSLEKHSLFPERANVSVAYVRTPDEIALRVWERGAGLTLACGTAACATLAAAHRRGLSGRKATVLLPGGALQIEWNETNNHILMTGPVATSFKGEFDEDKFRI